MKHAWMLGAATLALLLTATAHPQPAQPPLDLQAVQLTSDLFTAIRGGDAAATKAVLDRGADINRPNWIDLKPLDWAALLGKTDMAKLLLARGAEPRGGSYGTPLVAAILGGHEETALTLLKLGVDKEAKRTDDATTLMLAAAYSTPTVVSQLPLSASELAKQDTDGATALIYASRLGKTATVKRLLIAGAKVDQADNHGRTPLMYAAMNGYPEVVDTLLASKASPTILDKERATALHLTARYSGSVPIARSLIKAGAPLSRRDSTGKTPLGLAQERSYTPLATAFKKAGACPEPSTPLLAVRPAVQKSITIMEKGMTGFLGKSVCASCHHQGLGLAVLGQAAYRKFLVSPEVLKGNLQRIGEVGEQSGPLLKLAMTEPKMAGVVPVSEMGEFPITASYILWALDSNNVPASPGLSGMAQYVANQQLDAGNWSFTVHRGPMQESFHTMTALQVLGMRRFLEQKQSTASLQKARAWFENAPTKTMEDRAARLLGLRWSGGDPRALRAGAASLTALQNPDGGWSGRPGAPSDPLTTGLALYSLRAGAGIPVRATVIRKATNYLLRHQDENGSWYVNKTTAPLNYFFDMGFPGGESQYISFAATGWATLALMETTEAPKTALLPKR